MTRAPKPDKPFFGGPIDGRGIQPPMYYVNKSGHQYVLLSEVGAMVERLVHLPAHYVRVERWTRK